FLSFFYRPAALLDLHSFPTRRSSDLVAVPAGHLVADGDDPLGGDVHLDHLLHAAGQLVAALQRVEPPLLLVEQEVDPLEVLAVRSEEHTSELQSLAYLVCRLLLEKKN